MSPRASNVLKWWPVVLLGIAFSTWAATEYIDDRIDTRLGAVVDRLYAIEKTLISIDERLKGHMDWDQPQR